MYGMIDDLYQKSVRFSKLKFFSIRCIGLYTSCANSCKYENEKYRCILHVHTIGDTCISSESFLYFAFGKGFEMLKYAM